MCLSVGYRRPHFWTDLHQIWCRGVLTCREGPKRVGFAARPPGSMWQTLDLGKPESTYITCIQYFRLSSWLSRQPLNRFQPNLVCGWICYAKIRIKTIKTIEIRNAELLALNRKCCFFGNRWTNFNQNWCVDGYTMFKSPSKKSRRSWCAASYRP